MNLSCILKLLLTVLLAHWYMCTQKLYRIFPSFSWSTNFCTWILLCIQNVIRVILVLASFSKFSPHGTLNIPQVSGYQEANTAMQCTKSLILHTQNRSVYIVYSVLIHQCYRPYLLSWSPILGSAPCSISSSQIGVSPYSAANRKGVWVRE